MNRLGGLGLDDVILIFLVMLGIAVIKFWLFKIYKRVRQIALIMEHFLRKG